MSEKRKFKSRTRSGVRPRKKLGKRVSLEDIRTERSYLTQSLEEIPLYRARNNSKISEDQRMELVLNELSLVRKEVENKMTEIQYKANTFRMINSLSSLVILSLAAAIGGLEAASECLNIAVIVMISIIFVTEGIHKLFRWGPQGVIYKQGTIQLKRIVRQIRDYMYMFHQHTPEQLLSIIGQLRNQYDEIDVGLYKLSMNGQAKFNTGLDIEQGNPSFLSNLNSSTPILSPTASNNIRDSPQVHIHINGTTPRPTNSPNSLHIDETEIPTINIKNDDVNHTPPISIHN